MVTPVLLLAALALPARAATLATAFTDDAGAWTGGSVASGVLGARDGAVALHPGAMRGFHLAARVRLAEGTRLWFSAGAATLSATYAPGGGLVLGEDGAPLPLGEQGWTADAAPLFDGAAPDVLHTSDGWFLYREVAGSVHAATSPDGVTWTDRGAVVAGSAPDAVDDGGQVTLYYGCPDRDAVCRATSPDGLAFTTEGPVLSTGGPPDVTVAPLSDGGWRLWYADGGGLAGASSTDGRVWTASGGIADASRLGTLDVATFAGGLAGVWTTTDGLSGTDAAPDADLADPTGDRGPLLSPGFATWSPDVPVAPSLARDGDTWHLYVEAVQGGVPRVGHLLGTPLPGAWVGLVADWDGALLTVTWGNGARLVTPLAAADAVYFGAAGLLEIDEAQLTYELAAEPGDTGDTGGADTGDTADTADTGDTGTADTGDTATDTAATDTDTALVADTAADPALLGAAELTGEPGGCGCAAPGTLRGAGGPLLALALLFVRRRR